MEGVGEGGSIESNKINSEKNTPLNYNYSTTKLIWRGRPPISIGHDIVQRINKIIFSQWLHGERNIDRQRNKVFSNWNRCKDSSIKHSLM